MAYSYQQYTGDGVTDIFAFSKPYLSQSHVTAEVDGVPTSFTWLTVASIQFATAPAVDAIVDIRRATPIAAAPVDWNDGSVLVEADMDLESLTILFALQEAIDNAADSIRLDTSGQFDALSKRIVNVSDAANPQDAVTLAQLIAAEVAAGNVPTPINPTDDNKFLQASGGSWAWATFVKSHISDASSFGLNWLGLADAAAGISALGLSAAATTAIQATGTGDLLLEDGDGSQLINTPQSRDTVVGLWTAPSDLGDPLLDIFISEGNARDDGDVVTMVLSPGIVKRLTTAWAEGHGNGGLDTGTIAANTWYHTWLIRNPTSGNVDALFSLSATAPTMPAGYTQKRRIGSVLTDGSSQIVPYRQRGDDFTWDVQVQDFFDTNPPTTAVTRTLTVPTGVEVFANFLIHLDGQASGVNDKVLVTSLDQTDTAPSITMFTVSNHGNDEANTTAVHVKTNTSAEIRTRSEVGGTSRDIRGHTIGWADPRGRKTPPMPVIKMATATAGTLVELSDGAYSWVNPQNAKAVDGSVATVDLLDNTPLTANTLEHTNFGFNIPADAVILGIEATIGLYSSLTNATYKSFQLIKSDSTRSATTEGVNNTNSLTLDEKNFGTSASLWGETWSPSDINSPNFGVAHLHYDNAGVDVMTLSVDYVKLNVYYAVVE